VTLAATFADRDFDAPVSHPGRLSIPVSLLLHAALVVLLALATFGRPLPRLAPPRAIEVEIITQMEYEDEFEVPPDVAVTPLAVPVPVEEPDAALPAPADGLRQATELFTNRVLADPQNRQVREALPSLESTERVIQLCNIEGIEQLHVVSPDALPDSISPAAFAPTILRGYTLEAPDAAYRAARKWFHLRFTCTVSPDFGGVDAYAFAAGDAIPEEDWEAHDLIAEDEDE
jgi:hypothetical protein